MTEAIDPMLHKHKHVTRLAATADNGLTAAIGCDNVNKAVPGITGTGVAA